VVTADIAYDSEDNHLLVREQLGGFSVIPSRTQRKISQYGIHMEATENK
jgi:hypothetical protein